MKVANNRLNSCTGKAWLHACVVAGKRPLGFSIVALCAWTNGKNTEKV